VIARHRPGLWGRLRRCRWQCGVTLIGVDSYLRQSQLFEGFQLLFIFDLKTIGHKWMLHPRQVKVDE
jgi:hypothetical protein